MTADHEKKGPPGNGNNLHDREYAKTQIARAENLYRRADQKAATDHLSNGNPTKPKKDRQR